MTDRWRYACPKCGSRQIRTGKTGTFCEYDRCDAGDVDPVDLKRA